MLQTLHRLHILIVSMRLVILVLVCCLSLPAEDSLYQRLGGRKRIAALVDELVTRLARDPRIGEYFAPAAADRVRLKALKMHLTNYVCEAAGGPCKYSGRDMKAAHRGLSIGHQDFAAFMEDFEAALTRRGIGETEKTELLKLLAAERERVLDRLPRQ
jgi:hemoglobin